ncbi:hypothetical protein MKX01_018219 [Papaver californicum]|nr:hypothetical protein MKX01_018219 [Papaver californicum]
MVKATKKSSGKEPPNPEAEERRRLINLGFSRNLLSQTPAKSHSTLNPSKTVIKSWKRYNQEITEKKQVKVKLFGTIVYPKNRYLTLQFSKGGKNVMCEDYFDNMIVFSEAWWIGTKDENAEEVRLEFPKELKEEKRADHDFKGGAGAGPEEKSGGIKPREEKRKPQSPTNTLEDDLIFAEDSPGDDSEGSEVDLSEIKGKKVIEEFEDVKILRAFLILKISKLVLPGSSNDIPAKDKQSSLSVCRSEKESVSKQGLLVQATIASLFQKVETKDGGPRKEGTVAKESKAGSSSKQKQHQVEYESIEDSSSESEV